MDRLKIAQYIALGATALSVIGGLGTAIKMAGGIAKWGWIVVHGMVLTAQIYGVTIMI